MQRIWFFRRWWWFRRIKMRVTLEGETGDQLRVVIWLRGNHKGKPNFDRIGGETNIKEGAARFLRINGGFNPTDVKASIAVLVDDLANERGR